MNRKDILEKLIDRTGLSRKEARWFLDQFFESIIVGLRESGRVEIRGFGVFKIEIRKQAGFFNPKNQQYYPGGDIKTVLFQPSIETR